MNADQSGDIAGVQSAAQRRISAGVNQGFLRNIYKPE
jgi:hypothetical protein